MKREFIGVGRKVYGRLVGNERVVRSIIAPIH